MLNKFCKKPLYEVTRTLARVAMGAQKAELVIRNARLVNVCTAEIQEGIDVAIAEGRIALVGDAAHCIGPETTVIDANGQYIAPGFMDGHIHVESSMISVGEYAKAVVPCGTTGIFMDPHEICNVCGKEGVRIMIEDAKRSPLKAMSNAPSCVPAVAGFEDTGAAIRADDIREMMGWDGIMGLGEMMSFPNVIGAEENIHAELAETLKSDNIITGHFSIPDTGAALNAYIASGIRCCHESTRAEDVLEKMRHGMYALMRYGSAWHDMPVIIKAVLDNRIDDRFACLISDDTHPDTLINEGHLDHIIRCAIREGLDPIKAIQYVTINVATCFRMDHEMGSITPGKCADIVFFDALVPGERDYSAILTKIKGVKPDAILFTGYYPEAGLLLRQMQEMKWAVPIIGGDATNNTDLVKIAGDAAAGYRFISPIMPADIDTPMAKAFLKAYEAKYHSLPSSIWSVLAGDAYNVLIAAIKAKGPDPAAIAGYLHNDLKNLDCFTGQISFDEKGDRVGDLYRLYEVNAKGEFILQPK